MTKLLTTLSVLTLGTTIGNLNSVCTPTFQKTNIGSNQTTNITQQDTIYLDKDGNEQMTSMTDLSALKITEVVQIGFYQNEKGEIQTAKMPRTIEKVPAKLPSAITSLQQMFASTMVFNQDISSWDVSNITNMKSMFALAQKFNQNLAKWNTAKVTNMHNMFGGTSLFNQNLAKWDTAKVTDRGFYVICVSLFYKVLV